MIQEYVAATNDIQKLSQALKIINHCHQSMSNDDFEYLLYLVGSLIIKKVTRHVFLRKTDERSEDMIKLCDLVCDAPFAVKLLPYLAEYTVDKHDHCKYISKMFITLLKLKLKDASRVIGMLKTYRMEKAQVEAIFSLIRHDSELSEAFKAFVLPDMIHIISR
eukprot:NODE_79_length_22985_cov_0.358401.p10 type:complete len:163 gc:universal NODE_79_length_22985_cov_0.358401:16599-17087(+)